jgi:PTH2 family peptidyl-tRNA hydrolase
MVMDAEDAEGAEAPERRLVIRVNSNAKMSRGKAAAHAVHAALKLYGIEYEHPVIVIGGKPDEILAQTVHVRDAGRTELEPGTLTAGASWEYKERTDPGVSE